MHMFFAYEKIDTGNRQNDHKQKDCRRGSIGREATAVPVKHVVNIADNRIHPSRVQIRSKQRNCVAVGFKRADKASDNQIKNHRRNHRHCDLPENSRLRGSVHLRRLVIVGIYRSEGAR